MTQEERQKEKELLLNVLNDGLPYGLQLKITDVDGFTFNGELRVLSKNWCRLNISDPVKRAKVKNQTIPLNYIYIKPYLRPLSSITEEERAALNNYIFSEKESRYFWFDDGIWFDEGLMVSGMVNQCHIGIETIDKMVDWLNAHHFDYRDLIEKGLAIEAPEGMYNN